MKITVDGKKRKYDLSGVENIETLLRLIYDEIRKDERIVTRIIIDGNEISPEKEEELGSNLISEFTELEIGTSTHREIAKESIKDGLTYIDHILKELSEIVKGLREGSLTIFGPRLMECLEDTTDFVELFTSIKATSSVDMKKIIIDGKGVDDIERLMVSAMKEIASTGQDDGINQIISSIEMILIPVLELFRRCIIEIDSIMEGIR